MADERGDWSDAPYFGRLFPDLPPWLPPDTTRESSEEESYGRIEALSETYYSNQKRENERIPAGYTYFGQFVNHDLMFDAGTPVGKSTEPQQLRSARTPRFDLDSVYGKGPDQQPYLYSRHASGMLLIGQTQSRELDLPRNRDAGADGGDHFDRYRVALLGDPRNDHNVLVSQLHLAFLRLHNRLFENALENPFKEAARREAFERARTLTRWHYQWVVIHDFLKRICGRELVDRVLASHRHHMHGRFLVPQFMPVELSFAVYRAGHAMARPAYHLSDSLERERGGRPLPLLGPDDAMERLEGGRELPRRWTVQWDRFVPWQGSRPQLSMRFEPKLTPVLRWLPGGATRDRSLSYRTLARGFSLRLPSGQSVAQKLGMKPLSGDDPLWLYILKEAEEEAAGEQLGPVGGQIVAEALVGFLAADPSSYLRCQPDWTPKSSPQTQFELADLLHLAGAPMTQADWSAQLESELIAGPRDPIFRPSGIEVR